MLNIFEKKVYDKYYNLEIFHDANNEFEKYLKKCKIVQEDMNFEDFNISTITCIITIADFLNIKVLYEQLEISNDIIYLEYKNKVKGEKKKKIIKETKTKDKRMKKKGKTFANQLSIGFNCIRHNHKKPICLKIFSKGSMTLTGVKDKEEIDYVLEVLIKKIKNINMEYNYGNKKIILYPYKNLLDNNKIIKKIETVNGSFKCNFNINLNKLKTKLEEVYSTNELYIKSNRSALLELDLLIYNEYDKRKNKNKTPKISIYGTGSIVINSINEYFINKSYEFIKIFLENNYNNIVDKNYIFNL